MIADRILFEPLLPPLMVATLCALLAFLALLASGRRGAWRWPFLAVVTLFLMGPKQVFEDRVPEPDVVAIVVDQSPSMQLGDRPLLAQTALARLLDEIEADADLEPLRVATPQDLRETALFATIESAERAVAADRLAGVVVISDGQAHDRPLITASGAPVHHLVIGDPAASDPQIRVLDAPAFGIIGDPARFVVEVTDPARPVGSPVSVEARFEGRAAQRIETFLGSETPITIPINRRGTNTITFTVDGVDGELTDRNNRAVVSLSGVRDRLRVLLVTGKPHAGARSWRDLLKSDPAVDLVHFTILRDPFKRDAASIEEMSLIAFPRAELFEERLSQFDLVVFDRYQQRNVLPPAYFQRMADYVADGGAMLIAAGPDFATEISLHNTLLSAVIPVAPTGDVSTRAFRPQISTVGAAHPITAGLGGGAETAPAWGRWFSAVDAVAIDGEVLLQTEAGKPLLVVDRIFDGRIGVILSDHAWLWARGVDGGGPFADLFRRTAHWLMGEPDLDEEGLFVRQSGTVAIVERRSLKPVSGPLVIENPSGQFITLAMQPAGPGLWTQRFPVTEPGLYNIQVDTKTTVLVAGAERSQEWQDLTPTATLLAPLIAARGGGQFAIANATDVEALNLRRVAPGRDAAGRNWLGLINHDGYGVASLRREAVLPGWAWALLALFAAALGWWREAR
jgi:hypothetical protein